MLSLYSLLFPPAGMNAIIKYYTAGRHLLNRITDIVIITDAHKDGRKSAGHPHKENETRQISV